jgi:hypothetical protein
MDEEEAFTFRESHTSRPFREVRTHQFTTSSRILHDLRDQQLQPGPKQKLSHEKAPQPKLQLQPRTTDELSAETYINALDRGGSPVRKRQAPDNDSVPLQDNDSIPLQDAALWYFDAGGSPATTMELLEIECAMREAQHMRAQHYGGPLAEHRHKREHEHRHDGPRISLEQQLDDEQHFSEGYEVDRWVVGSLPRSHS